MTNVSAIPKVARQGRGALRKLPDVAARFIGNLREEPACSGIRRFPRDFAVQPHGKVRGYDACPFGGFLGCRPDPAAVENLPHCGFLARKMLIKRRPMMAGYKRAGLSTPPFASSTERLNDQV
ncbi:hypothetical protein GCM10010987_42800 [Bradyrhizobium guangdongense]|uniref:Uncharacterized protein n=1 Tax=Bradyrhizobium guangdongense TaxID=1325090 RepID=A0AA87W5T4_9BRAD|nr:hypothetical protein GCM10010987_42800 [Bradyrhizobium guangdongense]